MNEQKKVLVILDNLRVGGIQRLALDEAYALNSRGYQVKVLLLESVQELDDMREIDGEFFRTSEIKVESIPGSNLRKIRTISSIIKNEKITKSISHSAKGVAILRISSTLAFKKIKIRAYIHQLITLSDPVQRCKRLVFFSFADELHASSRQFVLELKNYMQGRKVSQLLFRKKIGFDRMGVFVDRILAQDAYRVSENEIKKTTILFMSRVAIWKGFGKFIHIAKELGEDFDYAVITSRFYNDAFQIERLCNEVSARLVFGSNVSRFNRGTRSIHLYPADYGTEIQYPQNIGLNVLESIVLGIPSLISIEAFWSWPELSDSNLVWTTDWSDDDVKKKIRIIEQIPIEDLLNESKRVRDAISIENHVENLIKFLE